MQPGERKRDAIDTLSRQQACLQACTSTTYLQASGWLPSLSVTAVPFGQFVRSRKGLTVPTCRVGILHEGGNRSANESGDSKIAR
jgi:hypothetical protein